MTENRTNHNTRKLKYNRNIFPDDLDRILFHKRDPIVKSIFKQANFMCREQLNARYIKHAFNNFNYGYYYKDKNNSIQGFCIWKENKDIEIMSGGDFNIVTLLLICAQTTDYKLGKIMLFDLENFCLFRKIHIIQLQPANSDLIPYYESNGYRIISNKERRLMEKTITIFRINKNNQHKKTRKH